MSWAGAGTGASGSTFKLRHSSGGGWSRGGRGRGGRGRGGGGGANLVASSGGAAPALQASQYPAGVGPGLCEVVHILGKRNTNGRLMGISPPPGAIIEPEPPEEDEAELKRPPKPLLRRLIEYVREAWTGVKFALDSEYEEEQIPRYRPDSLKSLCQVTKFSEAEMKRLYRGFKTQCPTGVVREESFKVIYSQFFPQGANTSQYAHYVFNTLDHDHSGILSFEDEWCSTDALLEFLVEEGGRDTDVDQMVMVTDVDFVVGLSILSRGSLDQKLRWTFSLYDINGDGCITKEEMTDIVTAVYELMGKFADPNLHRNHENVRTKVDRLFQKMDGNKDGVVTLGEFLQACYDDPEITADIEHLQTAF